MAENGKPPVLVVVQLSGGNDFMNTVRRQRFGLSAEPFDDVLDAWLRHVVQLVDREVDSLIQRAAVYPLLARVPAFHGWRVHKLLTHQARSAA